MSKPALFVLAALAASVLVTSCTKGSAACGSQTASAKQGAHATIRDGKPAPNFTLQDATGQSVSLDSYKGKVVLLNFWATWCGPCTLEIPWFEEFEQQYKSKGFEVIGVSMDEEGWKAIKPYIQEHHVNYRVLLGNDSVGELYGGVDSLPTTFILNREGHFAFPPHIGLAGKNEYQSEIQSLLGENPTCEQSASLRLMRPVPAVLIPGAAK